MRRFFILRKVNPLKVTDALLASVCYSLHSKPFTLRDNPNTRDSRHQSADGYGCFANESAYWTGLAVLSKASTRLLQQASSFSTSVTWLFKQRSMLPILMYRLRALRLSNHWHFNTADISCRTRLTSRPIEFCQVWNPVTSELPKRHQG